MRTSLGRELRLAIQNSDRAAKLKLRRREGEFEGLEIALNALPGPLLQINTERRILRANEAAQSLLGGSLENRDLATVMRNPKLLDALDSALSTHTDKDVQFILPAPITKSFFARVVPLERPARDGTALILALEDLTLIERTDQMREDFVANASHEIRTPLATLLGFIETLLGPARNDEESREKFLKIMQSHAQRMSQLVEDLLSLSRIELNEHTPPTKFIDLGVILNSVCDLTSIQAEAKNVSLEIKINPNVVGVIGYNQELIQLFHNLVSNSIKYGNSNSTVLITVEKTSQAPANCAWEWKVSGAIAVSVIDKGEGIAREHLPRLTERFYRVDTARSRELGGTGLGLAIVKHIVSRHRGALIINSEVGIGSKFTVFLQPASENI